MDREVFDFLRYDCTEIYPSALADLPVLDDAALEQIGRVHLQWATEVASPFPPESPIPGFELWNFALSMVNTPLVEPALVTLQDGLQLSISIVLFCCWRGRRGHRLSSPELLQAIRHLEIWDRDVLGRMRAVRRTVAGDISFGSGLLSIVYLGSAFQSEQEAYKVGLSELQNLPFAGKAGLPSVRANLEQYLSLTGIAPGSTAEIDVLIAASESVLD